MKKNLNQKIVLIIAVLVVFVYGIIGTPTGFSGQALLSDLTKRIHLGLDLQGGVHLILQVRVAEAVNTETDNTVGRIEQDLKAANLSFTQVYKPDPAKPEVIRVEGTAPASATTVRSTSGFEVLDRVRPDWRDGQHLDADHEADDRDGS